MEDGDGAGFLDDWDAVAEEELRAIEAAHYSSSSATKRGASPIMIPRMLAPSYPRSVRRRLPNWERNYSAPPKIHGPDKDIGVTGTRDLLPKSSSINGAWSFGPRTRPGNSRMKYPRMLFSGRIIYCRTAPEVEKASMELLDKIKSMKQHTDSVSLGFDIEWRAVFRKGERQRKASVMQICVENTTCYVMHIIHSGIPPHLKSVLEDDVSVKVGVSIANDAWKIIKDYNVCVEPLEDLSSLANLKLGGMPKKWGLASLIEAITCKQLEKPNKIQLGNWEADVLSPEQLQYAATDAFASWYLHKILKGFPDVEISEDVGKTKCITDEQADSQVKSCQTH